MSNAPLRGCPTCGTKVDELDLGLRDYRWLKDTLPGRVAPTDIDFMLERHGHLLVLEFKREGQGIPLGQRITLKSLVQGPKSVEVWPVWGDGPVVEVGRVARNGDVFPVEKTTVSNLRAHVAAWFDTVEDE